MLNLMLKHLLLIVVLFIIVECQDNRFGPIDELCDHLEDVSCRSKAVRCVAVRHLAEQDVTAEMDIRNCALDKGLSRSLILSWMQIASSYEGLYLLDAMPLTNRFADVVRICALGKSRLLDDNGEPDTAAIKARFSGIYRKELGNSQTLLRAMLKALESCPDPVDIESDKEFRICLGLECIQYINEEQ